MINELEQKLHIEYPRLYKELEAKNMLNIDSFGDKIMPSLLYPDDEFWLLSKDDILMEIDDFYNQEHYLQVNKKYILVPFAKSGAGDLYCFLFSHKDSEGNIPIVYFWHDDEKADYIARNLEDFIFMKLLSYITEDGCNNLLEQDKLDYNILLETHRDFINLPYIGIIKEKYNLYTCHHPMPVDEYIKTLQSNTTFENYDKSFNYQK